MKRHRETDLLNFFTKRKQVSDNGNGTEEVCTADNSIGSVVNVKDLKAVSLNPVSVAQSEDLGVSTVTDVGHQNDFWTSCWCKVSGCRQIQISDLNSILHQNHIRSLALCAPIV